MKFLASAFLALVAGLALGEVKLVVKLDGKVVGNATTNQKLMGDGGRLVELRLTLTQAKRTVEIHTTSLFDAKGEPVRKAMDTTTSDHVTAFLIATFDKDGANLVIDDGHDRKTRKVAVESTAPRAETSGFWFLRDKPVKGAKVRQYAFNMDTSQWELTETEFVGEVIVTVSGHKIPAHLVRTTVGERVASSWLDDKGDPIRIEAGTVVMERAAD